MQLSSVKISNINNEADAAKLDSLIGSVAGVERAKASVVNKSLSLSFDETQTSLEKIKTAITAGGFVLTPHGEDGNCCGGCGS